MTGALPRALALLVTVLAASPALAGAVLDSIIGAPADSGKHRYACFTRVYDDAHLKAHPQQNVRTMKLLAAVTPEGQGKDDYTLSLAVTFRSRNGVLRTGGGCDLESERAGAERSVSCDMSCGGDSIEAKMVARNTMLLTIPTSAQLWNPQKPDDALVKGAFGPDDKLFRLDRAPVSACAELGADEAEKTRLKGL